jgi:hypothetical protein
MVFTKTPLLSQPTYVSNRTVWTTELSVSPRYATNDIYSIAVDRVFRAERLKNLKTCRYRRCTTRCLPCMALKNPLCFLSSR